MSQKFNYSYYSLDQIKEERQDYNFYGVVVDATFPYPEEYPTNYICILKVIDFSNNYMYANSAGQHYFNLIVKSNKKEVMPYIHRVGEVIRVHRGRFSSLKKNNIYLNIKEDSAVKSSFLLFPPLEGEGTEFLPYACSSLKYTFEQNDINILTNLRDWVKAFFSEEDSLTYTYCSKLDCRLAAKTNFDLLVSIKKLRKEEDQVILTLSDCSDTAELAVDQYFSFLTEGDAVRIRNVKSYNGILYTSEFSNFLVVDRAFKLYQAMNEDKSKVTASEEPPTVIAKTKKHRLIPLKTTSGVPVEKKELKNGDEFVREVNLIYVLEEDLRNCVKHKCKCGTKVSLKKVSGRDKKVKCTQCKKSVELSCVFSFRVVCQEDLFSNKTMEILVDSDLGSVSGFFFEIEPVNLFAKENKGMVAKFKRFMTYMMNEKVFFRGLFSFEKKNKAKPTILLKGDYTATNYLEKIFD